MYDLDACVTNYLARKHEENKKQGISEDIFRRLESDRQGEGSSPSVSSLTPTHAAELRRISASIRSLLTSHGSAAAQSEQTRPTAVY